MRLLLPQALLLLVPLGLLLWARGRVRGPALALRVALVVLLVLALAGPELRWRGAGSDLVVVVDRSRSMPAGSQAAEEELVRLLEPQRRPGDRLGVVSFGREARVEQPLSADGRFGGFTAPVDPEASDLAAALDAAGDLVPPERTGRVLVLSDGRATGPEPRAAARRLAARGLAVDVRPLVREEGALDVAVTGLQAPAAVAAREPFLLTATVKATRETPATLVLSRGGVTLARAERTLPAGTTVLTFRDLVEQPGLVGYRLQVLAPGDAVPENDLGQAVARVEGPPRVLLLTDHPRGTLARTLREAGLAAEVRAPAPLSLDQLDQVGAVVLEDVEAGRLGESGLHALAQFVTRAGGGLVMTGGRHAFGEGGYRKSVVEDVLPVSLEVREEQRKAAVAISLIMDCSCSMGVRVPDGRTKMELAAEGAVGALELLDVRDEASVFMVDTDPHEVFPMSPVSAGLPLGKVARGFSGGGGIYIDVGLETAESQILKSSRPTRHVLLFADAADSEEPGEYRKTVAHLQSQGVTVSVIGMGSPADKDADLLRDIAARGKGRVYFAEDVTSLPRIFSQETIAVARSTFVETPTATAPTADLAQLGRLPAADGPGLGGYNLTYTRPQASVGLRTADDAAAPVLAFWPRGLGRVVAFTGEVDGAFTGALAAWPGRRALLEQAVRWALPGQGAQADAVARASLQGDQLHVTLDLDPRAPPLEGTPTLVLLRGDGRAAPLELPLQWEDEDRLGARWTLPGSGTWHPVVRVGGRAVRAPPVTLPWAPEFEPAAPGEGLERLRGVARAGGGVERLAMAGLFQDAPQSEGGVPLAPWLVGLSVALVLAEVLTRRFLSGPRRTPRPAPARAARRGAAARPPAPGVPAPVASPGPAAGAPEEAEEAEEAPARGDAVQSALDEARARARARTRR